MTATCSKRRAGAAGRAADAGPARRSAGGASSGASRVRLVHRPYNRGARREPSAPGDAAHAVPSAGPRAGADAGPAGSDGRAPRRGRRRAPASVQDGDGVPPRRGRRPPGADTRAPGRPRMLGDHQRRHAGPRVPPAHLAVPGLAASTAWPPAYPAWRDTINLRPGRAGGDPDPVPRLRGPERVPLPHRRARRRRDDGHRSRSTA